MYSAVLAGSQDEHNPKHQEANNSCLSINQAGQRAMVMTYGILQLGIKKHESLIFETTRQTVAQIQKASCTRQGSRLHS